VWVLLSDASRNGIKNGTTPLMGKYVLYREREVGGSLERLNAIILQPHRLKYKPKTIKNIYNRKA